MSSMDTTGSTESTEEDKLIVWWCTDLEKEDVFVLPISTVEEGVRILGVVSAYDNYLEEKEFKKKTAGDGEIAFLNSKGEIVPWSYISIAHGGKKYTDPMKWMEDKYLDKKIIV